MNITHLNKKNVCLKLSLFVCVCVCVCVCACVGLPYRVRYFIDVHTNITRYTNIARYFSHDLGMLTSLNAYKYHHGHSLKFLRKPRYSVMVLVCVLAVRVAHPLLKFDIGPEYGHVS